VLIAPARSATHIRAARAAIRPTLRMASLGSVAATVAFGILPVVVTVGRGGRDVFGQSVLAAIVAGAALGWAAEDEGGELLASAPVRARERFAIRLVATAAVAAAALALAATVTAIGPGLPQGVVDRLPEALAAAAVAVGIGVVAARRGEKAVGPVAVIAGFLSIVIMAGLAMRWGWLLPTFLPSSTHSRWWIVVAGGALVAARAGRDAGQR
jgi:hypothetical protein